MHTWLGALVSILLVAGSAAGADEKKEHSTPQAQRMTECNAQARDRHLSGDERRHFMSDCLKAHPAAHDAAARSDKAPKSRAGGRRARRTGREDEGVQSGGGGQEPPRR